MSNHRTSRIEKWDVLRAFLIFLVVLGHIIDRYRDDGGMLQSLWIYIYTFHMPCFLFLDGLFSKKSIQNKSYTKAFSYLILYVALKMIRFLTVLICTGRTSFSLFYENGLPWYAMALFLFYLATMFLSRYSKTYVLIAVVLLGCFAGYDENIGALFSLNRVLNYYPYFFLGYCLDLKSLENTFSKYPVTKLIGAVISIAFPVCCIIGRTFLFRFHALYTGSSPYSVFEATSGIPGISAYAGILHLVLYVYVTILCLSLIAAIPDSLTIYKFLAVIGRRSLIIYMLHWSVIFALYETFGMKEYLAVHDISKWIFLPMAVVIVLLFSLPFWEKPIRALIYPKTTS